MYNIDQMSATNDDKEDFTCEYIPFKSVISNKCLIYARWFLYRPIILIYFVLKIFTIIAESEKTQVKQVESIHAIL
jgi:hypothetical protein